MLIRCDVYNSEDLRDLALAALFARALGEKGFRIEYAVNRSGFDAARTFLGADATIYRIPEDEDEDAQRMEHQQRRQNHQNLLVLRRKVTSGWLFHMHRRFRHVTLLDRGVKGMVYAGVVVNPELDAAAKPCLCNPEARLMLGPRFFPTHIPLTYSRQARSILPRLSLPKVFSKAFASGESSAQWYMWS